MKFTPAKDILEFSDKQREILAMQIFDANAISEKISRASVEGFNHVRLSQEQAINLKHTKYAVCLEEALCKAGFLIEWVETSHREYSGKRETSSSIIFPEMCITWGLVDRRPSSQKKWGGGM